MKKILVPIDFSECANNALNFAVQMAKLLPWNITLLHSIETETGMYMDDYSGAQRAREEQMLEDAKQKLQLLKNAIAQTENIFIEAQISTGAIKENIITGVKNTDADLIVMGTMGISGKKLWGTKTAAITGESTVPVIAVPYSYNWNKPHNILFATNLFEKNLALLNPLFEIAGLLNGHIHTVVFTDENSANGLNFINNSRGLSDYKYFLTQTFPNQHITTEHISGNKFEDALQQYIDQNNIGMIAMISRQRGFLSRLMRPSATRSMAYHATIPLLVIPDII
jgi:nucleotide-binding universal stress UspA family protein